MIDRLPIAATSLFLVAINCLFVDASPLVWQHDYGKACKIASDAEKLLCILFSEPGDRKSMQTLEYTLRNDPTLQKSTDRYIFANFPIDASVIVQAKRIKLLDHGAFHELHGKAGLAILDFRNESPHRGHVVSIYPLPDKSQITADELSVLLDLPVGTLTQRTLIFAVRTHPERPQSTTGNRSEILAKEAERHSMHQASLHLQGHHNWDTRFHRINALMKEGAAKEVVAESWPGQNLFESACECVHSWRQSPGHWEAVRQSHLHYGYDMKRGANGVWYGTGIFVDSE